MCTDAPLILDPLLKWIKQPMYVAVKLKRREVSTETGTLPNWTRTYCDFFLFELTTTKILRNIKIVVAHATWPAVGRIGCAGLPRPIWSKLDADVSVVLTPIIYLHWSSLELCLTNSSHPTFRPNA